MYVCIYKIRTSYPSRYMYIVYIALIVDYLIAGQPVQS